MKNHSSSQQQQQWSRGERILANGLGVFSIGLGLAELFAANRVAKLVGVGQQLALIRAMGMRELGSGAGLLSQRAPGGWALSRLGGDIIDLAMLGAAARSAGSSSRNRLAIAAAAVAAVAALDFYCSRRFSRGRQGDRSIHFNTSITVDRWPEDLYRAWRNFEALSKTMKHLLSVEKKGENVWHWTAKGPAGSQVQWDAEIVEDVPNERIVWRSLENADVPNSGSVRFESAPEGQGTLVTVNLLYQPPAGKLGARIAHLFGQSPEQQIPVDLHRFKQWMETGEIGTTEGQPAGRSSGTSRSDTFLQS